MESTFIKIKFTPLIKHVQKDNTNYCLEIVPHVSSIENLDKIEWNKEKVEYNVSVTYKIILSKDSNKDADKENDKIYYSCIDLRHLSSNSILAGGDVTKVISDNFVLSKVATNFETSSIISENLQNQNILHEINKNDTESFPSPCMPEGLNSVLFKKGDPDVKSTDFTENNKLERQICPERTILKETVEDNHILAIFNNKDKKQKLNVTSVCTLSTIDDIYCNRVYDNSLKNNYVKCIKYKHENMIDYQADKMTESLAKRRYFYCEDNQDRSKNCVRSGERILREMRVANFIMSVENEILPLKILLSEIYTKCASLGLLWNSNVLQSSHQCAIQECTDTKNAIKSKVKKHKCNRVVYSVIFAE